MPPKYNEDAIALCRKYYIQFGGNADEIEKAMRKDYPGWTKRNLPDKGKPDGKHYQHGWITRYGFEKSLEIADQTKTGAIENDDERSYSVLCKLGILYEEKAMQGDDKAVPILLKINDQKIEFRSKLDLSSSTFESFVESFEDITKWAKEIDARLAQAFYKNADAFIKNAELKYGKSSNNGNG